MAEDMIQRAARAIVDEQRRRADIGPTDPSDAMTERMLAVTRAGLLAALDPEDEALVQRVWEHLDEPISRAPEFDGLIRRVIGALKTAAQGEPRG